MRTVFEAKALESDYATALYEHLKDNIQWDEGIRSRRGPTRLAKKIDLSEPQNECILQAIEQAMVSVAKQGKYMIYGVYLNYYPDGNSYTPNHSHPKTVQIVISLGGTRTLKVGQTNYEMTNGNAIIFGSSVHGVPKQEGARAGRISIATFMKKL